MKSAILVLLFASASAFAAGDKAAELPECAAISKACEAAGYMPGQHKVNKKGLWADCVGQIAHGKPVAGVSNSADEAKTCMAAAKKVRHGKG